MVSCREWTYTGNHMLLDSCCRRRSLGESASSTDPIFFGLFCSMSMTPLSDMEHPLTGNIAHLVVFKDGDAILEAGAVLSSGDKGITYRIGLANYTSTQGKRPFSISHDDEYPEPSLLHFTVTVDSFPSLRTITVVVFSWRPVASIWQSTTH